jgi:hypothetical protein
VLLGLRDDARAAGFLRDAGITDGKQLVDAAYPVTRAPLSAEQVRSYGLRIGATRSPPQPGPGPPVFERFTAEALERARMYGPNPAHQATGILADTTRQIVAKDALKQACRRDHHYIGTGHLLLVTADSHDRTAERIIGTAVMGSERVSDRIAREVVRALPTARRCQRSIEVAFRRPIGVRVLHTHSPGAMSGISATASMIERTHAKTACFFPYTSLRERSPNAPAG